MIATLLIRAPAPGGGAGGRRAGGALRPRERPARHHGCASCPSSSRSDDAGAAWRGERALRRAPDRGADDLVERPPADDVERPRLLYRGGSGCGDRSRSPWEECCLHAVRPASVRDRLERAHCASVWRPRRALQDRGVHAFSRARRLAGVLEFSRLSVGDPTVAVGFELDVIAAVIIGGGSLSGGRGTVVGTLAGAAIMTVIQVGCSQLGLPNWVQQIVTGGSSSAPWAWISGVSGEERGVSHCKTGCAIGLTAQKNRCKVARIRTQLIDS